MLPGGTLRGSVPPHNLMANDTHSPLDYGDGHPCLAIHCFPWMGLSVVSVLEMKINRISVVHEEKSGSDYWVTPVFSFILR